MSRLAFVAMLAIASLNLTGQVTTGTLYGTVIDPSGALVPDVEVTITQVETGAQRTTATDREGQFALTFLPVGTYSLNLKKTGFKDLRREGITLTAGQEQRLPFTLQIGSSTETVTVTEAPPQVNTVNAEQTETHLGRLMADLPLVRRDWAGMLQVGTGTTRSSYLPGGQAGGVVMNGLPASSLRLTVDGTESSENPEVSSIAMFGGFNIIRGVSLEAVSELSVNKGIMSAEVAGTMSGNININTKGGTNEFHGSLFENYQSNVLNARNQFLTTKPPVVYNQFGGSIGGPVIRNKLFFFGVYEGYRQRRFATINRVVASSEWRTRAIAAVPAYKQFFDIQPLPNQPVAPGAATGVYLGAGSNKANDNHMVFRGDYLLNNNNIFTARYTRGRPDQEIPRASTSNYQNFIGENDAVTGTWFHTAPAWTSETRFGYKRNAMERIDGIYTLGIPGLTQSNRGYSDAGEYLASSGKNISIEQVFAKTIGRHSLKAGFLYENVDQSRPNVEMPQVTYCNDDDFFANIPCSVQVTFGINPYLLRNFTLGGFLQDDFRVRPGLTLNFGVRYDYYGIPNERDDRLFNRSAPFGFGPLRPADSIYAADRNNFSPRAGFSWQLDRSGKTVIRGGAGIFHSRPPLMHVIELVANAVDEPFRVVWSRAEALNLGVRYPVTNEASLPLVKGRNFLWTGTSVDQGYRTPYSIQWQFGLQHQLTSTLALETGYIGNRGANLLFNRNMNEVDRITGLRPMSGFGRFRYNDNSDSSSYNAWQTSLRKRFSNDLLFNLHYTWAKALSYQDGDLITTNAPQDPNNIRLEHGPAPHDVTHRFASDFVYELPFYRLSDSTSTTSRLLLRGWQLAGIVTIESGFPFSISQGNSLTGQRIDYVAGDAYAANSRETLQFLNRSAFALVPVVTASGATARPGTLGRNSLRGPGFSNFDIALTKNLRFTESTNLQIRFDMFNAFNHTNFTGIASNLNAINFGKFTSTRGAREMQVSARFSF